MNMWLHSAMVVAKVDPARNVELGACVRLCG